mgnify:FL=1
MRRNFHSLSGVRFDPNFWNRKLPLSLWLLLLVSFLVSFLFTLPAPTLAHNLDQDPALSAIVNMIITHADQDEVVEEAWNWARERARMEELRQALISEATKRKSATLFRRAAESYLKFEGLPEVVSLLEQAISIDDDPAARSALSQIWLRGGWPEEARKILGNLRPTAGAQFIFQIIDPNSSQAVGVGTELSPDDLQLISDALPFYSEVQKGSRLLLEMGYPDTALRLLIHSGDSREIETLLSEHPESIESLGSIQEALAYCRLVGQRLDPGFQKSWFQRSPALEELWRGSMGMSPQSVTSLPDSELPIPSLLGAFASLEKGDERTARKIVAIRQASLTPLQRPSSISEELFQRKPEWFSRTLPPEQREKLLSFVKDPEAAKFARMAALHSDPGSALEARLWFHAGRLSEEVRESDRARRLSPDAAVSVEILPGVLATWPLSAANSPRDIPAQTTQPGQIIGRWNHRSLRVPGPDLSHEEWHLQTWRETGTNGEPIQQTPGFSLEVGDLQIEGDESLWSLQFGETSIQLSRVGDDSRPLLDPDSGPRLDLLQLWVSSLDKLVSHVPNDRWPTSVIQFMKSVAHRERSSAALEWASLIVKADALTVNVSGLEGQFSRIPVTPSIPLAPADTVFATITEPELPLPIPDHLELLHNIPTSGEIPAAQGPQDILWNPLPSGEQILSTTGTTDRIVITRSGWVGYIEENQPQARWWRPLLEAPLPGPLGFAPLPKEEVGSNPIFEESAWASSASPRVVSCESPYGVSSFLLISDKFWKLDRLGPQVIDPPKNYLGHCAAATLAGPMSETLILIESSGLSLVTPKGHIPLPQSGGYSVHPYEEGVLVLGQEKGQSWLSFLLHDEWHPIILPPLPGERDRPDLRATSITTHGEEIYLLADRLWRMPSWCQERGQFHGAMKPLTPAPEPGAYRAVRWVQPAPLIQRNKIYLLRPWGNLEVWGWDASGSRP